ncbi:MAG: zf-HC2 domain-containing protein [Dethiobacteria bacterium]|mgnify:CR=1 FL=1|jgi:hypothetical protein
MKISCSVIRDILPLYAEDMASEDTRRLVEEHIASCGDCRKQLDEMGASHDLPPDIDTAPLKKMRATLRKNRRHTVIIAVMFTLAAVVTAAVFLTTPRYIPYSESTVSIEAKSDGTVLAIFGDEVSGFYADHSTALIGPGCAYHITAWDSLWSRHVCRKPVGSVVLNTDGETVAAVYYYDITRRAGHIISDGASDILIYGKDQVPDGGVATLPRGVLAIYAFFALILVILGVLAAYLFRRHGTARKVLSLALPLPLAYLLASLCIKGFNFASYSVLRDFGAILLLTVPLYLLFLSAAYLIGEYRRI